MKRRVLLLALVCVLAPLGVRAQTAVSGNLKDVGVVNGNGSNTYVRFTLIDYGAQIPKVSNPTVNVIFSPIKDFHPDVNGNISGVIQGNDTITPNGTRYQVCVYFQGAQFRCNIYSITGSTFNLGTAIPVVIPISVNQNILFARTMTFTQPTPLSSWAIPHGFGNSQVYVFCTDLSGTQIFPDKVIWTDANDVTVNWVTPTSGNCLVMQASNVALTSPIGNAIVGNAIAPQVLDTEPTTFQGPVNLSGGGTLSGAFTGTANVTVSSLTAATVTVGTFKSSAANPAVTGTIELSNTDSIVARDGGSTDVQIVAMLGATPVISGFQMANGVITSAIAANGNPISLLATNGAGADGGAALLKAGSVNSIIGGASRNGGSASVIAGNGLGASGSGGNVILTPGTGIGNGSIVFNQGVGKDASGFKHLRAVGGCATSASIGAACSTTVTWTTPFADSNYTVLGCTGNGITSGIPIMQGITAKSAASITVQTVALTASTAQFSTIECGAVHD